MKLLVESLLVFVLTLTAAALVAQGTAAFVELAVVDALAAPCDVLWGDVQCVGPGQREVSWISP
ncbi:MAG TPA: hypothetical protein VLJ57_12070 [Burkholderiaceae bacterium]|nr:hypothetical protein [Burkholderiaceae bacterium]